MKNFIITKYTTLKNLFAAVLLCFFLLVFRIKSTQDYFGLFLVWNLFLAFIPLGIAWYAQQLKPGLKSYLLLGIWLLFLPNAPYVITDLVHLSYSPSHWLIYDAFVILLFAAISLYFGFLSILEMRRHFKTKYSNTLLNAAIACILLLCGFGIYLGRVVRFNSWDVVTNPLELMRTIARFLYHPFTYAGVWLFTLGFGLLLNLAYFIFQEIFKSKKVYNGTC